MERRLAAILAADVVGFSARAARDEDAAIRAVRGHLEAMELVIGLHRGRVVKTMGDGLLAEFGSVVDAVSGAIAAQARIAERNGDVAADDRLQFRIGVHSGDIVAVDGDILGDGVNVAARIEAVAPAGGVRVSARVHEEVAGKLDLGFTDAGEHALKNIERPMRLYDVAASGAGSAPAPVRQALPDKPSLAVLPFLNMSSDREDEYFADGLTEDLITALAHVPWIFVIARNSTFTYKGVSVDVRQVGRELGVRYVLEGSVRRAGERLRITGQLVDAESGAHHWADRFDGTVDDVFDLQDRITEAVVAAIAPSIRTAEIERAARARPGNLDAYDHYLRALAAINRARIEDAAAHLEQAAALAPDYAKAVALLGYTFTVRESWLGADGTGAPEAGLTLAKRALEADDGDMEVAAYAGYTLSFFGDDVQRGLQLLQTATERCPSFAWAWTSRAMMEMLQGDPERALEFADRSRRLNPRDPLMFRAELACAGVGEVLDRPELMLTHARAGLRLNPNIASLHTVEIMALVRLGRLEEATESARRLLVRHPDFGAARFIEHKLRFRNFRGNLERDCADLRAAGLPG